MNRLGKKWQGAKEIAMAFLRELTDEAAYQRHCRRMAAAGQTPSSPQEFYAKFFVRKYAAVRRCC